MIKAISKRRASALLSAIALTVVAGFMFGGGSAQAASLGSGGQLELHVGSSSIELVVGGPGVSVPASAVNPRATGMSQVRLVPGGELGSQAPSVLLVTGGTLQPATRTLAADAPLSASGCSPSISPTATCISVIGSGLTVNFWGTSAYYGKKTTCDAQFLVAGQLEQEDFFECNGPGFFQDSYLFVPTTFSGKTQVCNYWPGASGGRPCETVHA